MKALQDKVNVIPLVSKADCLTPAEMKKMKDRVKIVHTRSARPCCHTQINFILLFKVREEIEKFGIKVYQFPDCDSDEDEEMKQQDRELKVRLAHLKEKSHEISLMSQLFLLDVREIKQIANENVCSRSCLLREKSQMCPSREFEKRCQICLVCNKS